MSLTPDYGAVIVVRLSFSLLILLQDELLGTYREFIFLSYAMEALFR